MNSLKKTAEARAQSLVDYIILLGLVSTVIFSMNTFLRRSIQAMVKGAADHIGVQEESDQDFEGRQGYLVSSFTDTRSRIDRKMNDVASSVSLIEGTRVETFSNSLTNLGFVEGD